jgi:hypothetical protein
MSAINAVEIREQIKHEILSFKRQMHSVGCRRSARLAAATPVDYKEPPAFRDYAESAKRGAATRAERSAAMQRIASALYIIMQTKYPVALYPALEKMNYDIIKSSVRLWFRNWSGHAVSVQHLNEVSALPYGDMATMDWLKNTRPTVLGGLVRYVLAGCCTA